MQKKQSINEKLLKDETNEAERENFTKLCSNRVKQLIYVPISNNDTLYRLHDCFLGMYVQIKRIVH